MIYIYLLCAAWRFVCVEIDVISLPSLRPIFLIVLKMHDYNIYLH